MESFDQIQENVHNRLRISFYDVKKITTPDRVFQEYNDYSSTQTALYTHVKELVKHQV